MRFEGDPLAFYGKLIIEEHHASLLKKLPKPKFHPDRSLPDPLELSDDDHRILPDLKIGILGAGVGGLYAALILDSLGIKYDILEATGRAGGRLSTHHFDLPEAGEYDYYEEGAMRFPLPKKDGSGNYKNGVMKRLAELIEYEKLNPPSDRLKDKLIPYYNKARNPAYPGFYYFNGIYHPVGPTKEPSGFQAKYMGVGAAYVAAGSDAIQSDVYNPFSNMLIDDMETGGTAGWTELMKYDAYSVRGYMASVYLPSLSLNLPEQHLSTNVINWCNLLEESSAGYETGLAEQVFEALAFGDVEDRNWSDVDWKCFDGGSETLPQRMRRYIESTDVSIKFNRRVTAIGQGSVTENDTSGNAVEVPCVTVTVNGEPEPEKYAHVISTLPPTVLRTIDLSDAGLNVMQRNALRALNYGPSVKIAVLFRSNWWTTKLGIVGGQSFTDLPIRTIVYPSYGVDSGTPSKVLIASYTWTSDANRLGALALREQKEVLKELVLRNLAEAHKHRDPTITYEYLFSQCLDIHVKDWSNDEYTMGAFAEFLPGEFEDLYASLNVPAADGRLHFAGETLSTRHAWVVGALDSAWKAVYQYLKITGQDDTKFKQIWGTNVEWVTRSTLLEDGPEHDLLDEHIGLVRKAVLAGLF